MSRTRDLTKLLDFEAPALPALNALIATKGRILSRWPDVVANPPEKDRERLVQEVRRRQEADQWEGTPMSLVTSGARALFHEDLRARRDLHGLREFYYAEIRVSTRRSFLASMVSVYVATYVPAAPHTRELAAALTSAGAGIGGMGQQLLRHIPALFDPARAHEAIADKMVTMDDCWIGLKEIGLLAPHAPGLMDHAHLDYVRKLAPGLTKRSALERLFNWLKPEGQSVRASGADEAIRAILAPWLTGDPPQAELTFITETLIGLYGDPRVSGGGAWAGVPERHLAVMMRWLTGENIRFFLDVVSAVEESHMWEPRRKFWLSLHDQKRIDAAWVAFSSSGVRHAQRQLRSRGSRSLLSYGRQMAGGSRTDTSLLIMKIGNKVIVEGSHSYKVHIFKDNNPRAPRLYQTDYDCEMIRGMGGSETKSHQGDWQGWVLERV